MTPTLLEHAIPDLTAAIAYLFTAYRKPLDDATGLVYEHQLAALPLRLVREAVVQAPDARPFLPTVAELKADCEALRLHALAALVWHPCAGCRDHQPGWATVVDAAGVERLTRCRCWTRHQQAVVNTGLPLAPLVALPAGREPEEATP
ncbi:MAG TPA: hypothetical protein VKE26_26185 [Xanthobacteraceae bacterium]|nr:hypothetical protein [Xanthobacteraceae bacterium]